VFGDISLWEDKVMVSELGRAGMRHKFSTSRLKDERSVSEPGFVMTSQHFQDIIQT
jgi:hypothetical protein